MDPIGRLAPGAPAPRQQTGVTCGAACLAVARAATTRAPLVVPADGEDPETAWTALERRVLAWTNALRGPGGPQLPWPRFWGTPPWGARAALENGVALAGTRYAVETTLRRRRLGTQFDRMVAAAGPGTPILLYVGDHRSPRHVVLVVTPAPGAPTVLYEPARGLVEPPRRDAFVSQRLGLAGWDVPWLLVLPRGA